MILRELSMARRLLRVLLSCAALALTVAIVDPSAAQAATAAPAAVDSGAVPVAVAVKLDQDAAKARLVFDLSAPLAASAFVLADPARVIVDLPEVNFQIDPASGRNLLRTANGRGTRAGIVSAFRFGMFAPGKSRIVIDLTGPARLVRTTVERIADGLPSRLVVELAATDEASFRTASAIGARSDAVRTEPPTATIAAPTKPEAKPVVVLDPGHGGIDAGAAGIDGVQEKDVVFAFSRLLADKLEATGRYTVVLTRSSDMFVSLDDRVQIARQAHAALFVSIHADTISSSAQVAGATVYTVSERASDAEAARIAETENKADLAGGIAKSSGDVTQVADILFDLTRRETRAYSHVFSRTLINYLKDATNLNVNPARSAGFVVLKAPEIPSVLLELGYLSSRSDVKQLESPEWRDRTSTSIVAAIDRFFTSHQSGAKSAPDAATVARPQQTGEIAPSRAAALPQGVAGAPH